MGIDVIGWNGCDGGAIDSPDDLLDYMKLRAYKQAVDASVPENERRNVTVSTTEERMTYAELSDGLAMIAAQASSCRECFEDRATCYAYLSYPIDARCEELLFQFFLSSLEEEDSPAGQIARDYLADDDGEHWLDVRTGDERLLDRAEPLRGTLPHGGAVDSTRVLEVLFSSLDSIESVTAFALFWEQFTTFARQETANAEGSVAEILAFAPLFRDTFRKAVEGASECQVIFYA